ncbi:MAG: Hint domain-containing protein [Pseudomonadota bacterium]
MDIVQSVQAALARAEAAEDRTQADAHPEASHDADPAVRIVGIHANVRVSTSFGDVPAQLLRPRDMLRTRDGNFATIRRIEKVGLDEDYLNYHPEAQPVLVRAGAFGQDCPRQDALFAPGQLLQTEARRFGTEFRCAAELSGHPKVMRSPTAPIIYYVIDCGRPATILAERVWTQI